MQLESLLGALVEALDVGARCMATWRLMRALLSRRCYTHCLKMEMGRMDTLHTVWTKLLQASVFNTPWDVACHRRRLPVPSPSVAPSSAPSAAPTRCPPMLVKISRHCDVSPPNFEHRRAKQAAGGDLTRYNGK